MSDLLDAVVDNFPANDDVAVPLNSVITLTISGVDYDTTSLEEGFFVEGPDTDMFLGPAFIELEENVSQGDLDDFLESPGYQGIVQGTTTVTGVAGNTLISFTPTLPLSPSILYVANLSNVTNVAETDIDGFISFSFTTGTGSIETIPSTASTSILSAAIPESVRAAALEDLTILSVTPANRSTQNSIELEEIVITFNKPIDESSIDPTLITITTTPATDHPEATTNSIGDLAKVIEVDGAKLKLKI